MKIKGEGFILRPITLKDSQGYWEVMQDSETIKRFGSVPNSFEEAEEEIKEYLDKIKKEITEVFTIEVEGEYAGNVKLDKQGWKKESDEGRIHLWLHPDFRGKGLATKALKLLVDYGLKKKKFKTIYAQCKKSNKAVCRVNEKIGFKKVEDRIVDGVEKVWWELKK